MRSADSSTASAGSSVPGGLASPMVKRRGPGVGDGSGVGTADGAVVGVRLGGANPVGEGGAGVTRQAAAKTMHTTPGTMRGSRPGPALCPLN